MDLLVLSLFCGAGGLDLGFTQAGFRTLLAIDIYQHAVSTVSANFEGTEAVQADLCQPETLDLILDRVGGIASEAASWRLFGVIGGPPCQGFSTMNASNNHSDPRNQLVFRYAEILRMVNRRFNLDFFVFENVPALVSPKYRDHFRHACSMFESAGYRVSYDVLDSIDFGVPQYRKRVFVVGINERHNLKFDFQRIRRVRGPRNVEDVLSGLPSLDASNKYSRQDFHPNHRSMKPYSPKIAQIEPGDMKRKSFKRLAWDQPSPTVAYGHNEVHIHPAKGDQDRRLSAYEAMLLQGFPPKFEFKGTLSAWQRLVSEAVSPPVAKAIAESIIEQLGIKTKTGSSGEVKRN